MRALRLAYLLPALLSVLPLSAQRRERTDSLVRLLGCDELRQEEVRGTSVRKALGHARFEHNATMLLCDTAFWYVDAGIINAFGNVRIIQNETILSSEKLDYLVESNLAQFRGTVVQLQDKNRNTLRTSDLDYNTKDSVATFRSGGAFRDQDGQVIEGLFGNYDSKTKLFVFRRDVNMYTDSIFIKTDLLTYNTETSVAEFGTGTNAWKGDHYMLSAKGGTYERPREHFLFVRNVHLLTKDQEAWCDSLHYWRIPNDARMLGHVTVIDTTRDVSAVCGDLYYQDSLRQVTLRRNAAVITVSNQDGKRDTTYLGGDRLVYRSVPKCEVDSIEFLRSKTRLDDVSADPVTAYRRKAAEERKAQLEEEKKKQLEEDPNAAGAMDRGKAPPLPAPSDEIPAPVFYRYAYRPQEPDSMAVRAFLPGGRPTGRMETDSLSTPADSLSVPADSLHASVDSLKAAADSLPAAVRDTTPVAFVETVGHVRVFRSDMQAVCDSLLVNGLDSLVRMYKDPVVWNEVRRQYSADSIYVVVRNQALEKASLMSSAFIIVQEDSLCFDQIRGAEMLAFFDSTGGLQRFDALGGASGLFYIEENDAFATVNKFESKMFTAAFRNGEIVDINYFDEVKSNVYPVVQLKEDEKTLKGFRWQPERRPADPTAVTPLTPRTPEREQYESVPRPQFKFTEKYFPGYMQEVYVELSRQDSLARVRQEERRRRKQEADSLSALPQPTDSLAVSDTLLQHRDSLAAGTDSLQVAALPAVTDTLSQATDSLRTAVDSLPPAAAADTVIRSPEEEQALQRQEEKARRKAEQEQQRAERERKQQERTEKREARWAELDERDAQKEAVRNEKRLKRQRRKTLKTLQAVEAREAKEQQMIEKYKARYAKRKAQQDKRKEKKEP